MARAIYKIINTINGKFYVGSSIDTRKRFKQHKYGLKAGTHRNCHLQNAWNKYGPDAFVFKVIQHVFEDESLEDIENEWLQKHVGKDYCYNLGTSVEAPMRGASHSEETRAKISAKMQKAVSEGRGGCFIPSEETRKKMSASLMGNQCAKGFKHTAEEVEAIRKRMLGNTLWVGRKHTDESRAKHGKRLVELTTGKEFPVMNDAVKFYGMPNMAAILRSIKGKKQIMKGPNAGLIFAYADDIPDVSDVGVFEGVTYPTTRPEAKATGAKHYFTGQPCKRGHIALRLIKGTCMICLKEDWTKENERRKSLHKHAVCKSLLG